MFQIRELRDDERAGTDALYRTINFATTPAGSLALVAELSGGRERVGLGRLVPVGAGAFELGGIWTAESVRGQGIAATMVRELIARAGAAALWCVPFEHLVDYYGRFGFVRHPPPWPEPIAAKVADCVARSLPAVAVLRR